MAGVPTRLASASPDSLATTAAAVPPNSPSMVSQPYLRRARRSRTSTTNATADTGSTTTATWTTSGCTGSPAMVSNNPDSAAKVGIVER